VTVLRKKLSETESEVTGHKGKAKRAENQLRMKEEELEKKLSKYDGAMEERTRDKNSIIKFEADAKRNIALLKNHDDMKKQFTILSEKYKKLQQSARGGAAQGGAAELKLKQMEKILENSKKEIERIKKGYEKAHNESNKYKSEAVRLTNELAQVKKKLSNFEPEDKKKAG